MNGYNNIDFKISNKEIFVLDINPRITSTFKIYNDIYDNDLLRLSMNPDLHKKLESCNNNEYALVHMFVKQEYKFKNFFMMTLRLSIFLVKDSMLEKISLYYQYI